MVYPNIQLLKRWSGGGKGTCSETPGEERVPQIQEERSENNFLHCNKSLAIGTRTWSPAKLKKFTWWCADIYSPQGCFHSYDSSLSLIQLTATHVGSGDSVQWKTTHKGMKASVHFSKAYRVSYLMFQTSLMAFMSLKMHIRLQHPLPAALFRMQMQFNTIRQDRKPRHFTGSTAFQLSGKIKTHQLNRQAGLFSSLYGFQISTGLCKEEEPFSKRHQALLQLYMGEKCQKIIK